MNRIERKRLKRKITIMKQNGMSSREIAEGLNKEGLRTGWGREWNRRSVSTFMAGTRTRKVPRLIKRTSTLYTSKMKTILSLGLSEGLTLQALREVIK
jgi:hypothetical protein